jgi:hypothetical protein
MVEQFVTSLISGVVGACLGSIVSVAVLKERMNSILARVEKQEAHLERVVHRDTCLGCKEIAKAEAVHLDERHDEIVRRLGGLESAFRSCFDDLVGMLKK